jgi:dTDP-4-amino-4,6-dideoxygalactose transaminase
MMTIPYRDLTVKDESLKKELLEAVSRVLSHGRLIQGPEVETFEKEVAQYCSKRFAVGMNSGTDALYLALRSLDIGPGDEVITTPMSWIATFNAIVLCGATPVCVDIGEDLNIDPGLIEQAVTPKTRAILPVHFTGRICGMDRIMEIADKHGLYVIEDAAQAFGAHSRGRKAGSFGHVSCFSMNPMKVLCAYGEAGAVVTDDETIRDKLVSLRYAGTVNKENCIYPSLNGRMDTVQAAMLLVNMKYLEQKIDKLRAIARFYDEHLSGVVCCPVDDGTFHTYYNYTIITDKRDELKEYLALRGVETKVQHPILMPRHDAYKLRFTFDIPRADRLVQMILGIPNHENLTFEETEYIAACVREFFGK